MQNKKVLNKKGQVAEMPAQVLTFVVATIIIAVGGLVLGGIRDTLTVNSSEFNSTSDGLLGITKFSEFLPTIAIVLVSAILIAIVVGAFAFFRG